MMLFNLEKAYELSKRMNEIGNLCKETDTEFSFVAEQVLDSSKAAIVIYDAETNEKLGTL